MYWHQWSDLLFSLKNFWKVRPRIIRETKPSIGAIRGWMAGHDDEAGEVKGRLEAVRLAYRFVTYLRYLPDQNLDGDEIDFVLRNELAIEKRILRAKRGLRRAQSPSPLVDAAFRVWEAARQGSVDEPVRRQNVRKTITTQPRSRGRIGGKSE